jgi:hypothetical protein
METIKEEKMINLNLININIEKIKKIKEHQWVRFIIVIFAIAPFVLSFYFLDRISTFTGIDKIISIMILSLLMQAPVLIIGWALYYIYIKLKYPEKISERRYEFRISDYKTIHVLMSSFWMSGFVGVTAFFICLIFDFNQATFMIMLYGYLLLRLLIMLPIFLYRNKN